MGSKLWETVLYSHENNSLKDGQITILTSLLHTLMSFNGSVFYCVSWTHGKKISAFKQTGEVLPQWASKMFLTFFPHILETLNKKLSI